MQTLKDWSPKKAEGNWVLSMLTQLKSFNKCGGDLVFYEGDWRCWQCGQYYYATPSEPMAEPPPDPPSYPPRVR